MKSLPMADNVPEWASRYIRTWWERLLLHEWAIHVRLSPHPDEDGSGGTKAVVALFPDIRRANLEIRDDITADPDEEWQLTIIHELLHIRLGQMTNHVQETLLAELPPAARESHDRVFRSLVEPAVDLLAHTLRELEKEGLSKAENADA